MPGNMSCQVFSRLKMFASRMRNCHDKQNEAAKTHAIKAVGSRQSKIRERSLEESNQKKPPEQRLQSQSSARRRKFNSDKASRRTSDCHEDTYQWRDSEHDGSKRSSWTLSENGYRQPMGEELQMTWCMSCCSIRMMSEGRELG